MQNKPPAPFRLILMTRNNPAIKTRDEKAIVQQLESAGVPILEVPLHERAAFRALFSFNKTLRELTKAESAGLPRALENAEGFAYFVIKALKDEMRGEDVETLTTSEAA